MERQNDLPNGPAAAAILAAGIGSLALGLLTTLAGAFAPLANGLNFYGPTGPLSGETTMTVVIWLVAWAVLHNLWKDRQVDLGKTFIATLVMIALGLLGTFPPFFGLFGR
jgi:hypothetical protein